MKNHEHDVYCNPCDRCRTRFSEVQADREIAAEQVDLAAAVIRNNATTAELLTFVRWIAQHPDVGDGLTACERDMGFRQEARKLLAKTVGT